MYAYFRSLYFKNVEIDAFDIGYMGIKQIKHEMEHIVAFATKHWNHA